MKRSLLLTTALTGLVVVSAPLAAHAAITTTKVTTYTYDFPNSTPTSREDVDVVTNCPVQYSGGGGGGGGSGRESYRDTDGDGVSDTRTSGGAGQVDGYGGQTTSRNGSNTSGYGSEHYGGSGSSGGGGSSRVICTYFYQKGELDAATYYADMDYTRRHLKGATVRGYHFWAIPYARLMRQHPGGLLEALIRPVTIHRAQELAYQLGVRDKPNYLGKFFRVAIEPICFLIGLFVSESNWRKLYSSQEMKIFAADYTLYQAKMTFDKERAYHNLVQKIRMA